MEKFKIMMGFPMLATAVWLLSLTGRHFGTRGPLWIGIFLITVALGRLYLWGVCPARRSETPTRGLAVWESASP